MSLQIKNLRVCLGHSEILHSINLMLPEGCLFALLGSSGCGKSTLLKTIAGLIVQQSGHIFWKGEPIDALPPEKRGMVMVFQDLRLFPHMTIWENVSFPLKMAKVKKMERRLAAHTMLKQVQLEGLEDRRPDQLSGGQQQRVVLARALIARPRVLLLDEPFSSLDGPLRADMQELLHKLHRQLGTSMILVTHDQEEALSLSDRMAVMSSGSILQVGTPQQIYQHPKSLAVAQHFFRGNSIHGWVKNGRFSCDELSFSLPCPCFEGSVVALFPPESLTISSIPGSFLVSQIVYTGSYLNITLQKGRIRLKTKIPVESSLAIGNSVNININTEKILIFPLDRTAEI